MPLRLFLIYWDLTLSNVEACHHTAGSNKSQRELFLETLICNVDQNSRLLMTDVVPAGLGFHSSHLLPHNYSSSRHVGYIVHGQHEVKVTHKCDAGDGHADALPLTQEREPLCTTPSPLSPCMPAYVVAVSGVADAVSLMQACTSLLSPLPPQSPPGA